MKPELHDAQYWKDRPMNSDKDWVDDAPNWIESYVLSVDHPHRQLIISELEKIIPLNQLLEIGCNVGSNLLKIRQSFPWLELAGIDINKKCINKAKKYLGNEVLKVANYHSIPFADKSFDVVLADAVLMYSKPKDIGRAMNEIGRVSRYAVVIVDRFDKSKQGIRSGHVWARNYSTLLKNLGYKVKMIKIKKKDWPNSVGWQKFGYIFVGTK